MKNKILFVCTHNSARSQIAEGLVNHFYGDSWIAKSAGTEGTIVKPLAIESMKEVGIDISSHYSKEINEFKKKMFDVVVTVCDQAKESCPFFPGNFVMHASFADPSDVEGTHAERLQSFNQARDSIHKWLRNNLPELEKKIKK